MRLRVTHDTQYDYQPAVSVGQHLACLQPRPHWRQRLLGFRLDVQPDSAQSEHHTDAWGNHRQYLALQTPHARLHLRAESLVETAVPALLDGPSCVPWEAVQDRLAYRAGQAFDPACVLSFASAHAPRHATFAAYARTSFTPGRPLLAAARDLMQRIHTDFTYDARSTQVHTPALEALAQRRGVCQDFSHILLACLRSLGLAARYVSGYLLTEVPPGQTRLIGSDASHAWVSVYLPDLPPALCLWASEPAPAEDEGCWWDFDPTNNRDGWGSPGQDYVTMAFGRDFADVSPLRGVIHGGSRHTLTVGVTVEPEDATAAPPCPPIQPPT